MKFYLLSWRLPFSLFNKTGVYQCRYRTINNLTKHAGICLYQSQHGNADLC
jgi:hypothetical protein